MIYIIKAPVVMIVSRCPVGGEIFFWSSCVVDVRDKSVADLVTVFEKHMHTVVVL